MNYLLFLFIVCGLLLKPAQVFAAERFWPIVSIDTMKYSRDRARESGMREQIPAYITAVAALQPTHIAIGTPYDEEFYPVMKVWVDEIRKQNMHVWFRGNFSGWEGWFDYPKLKSVAEHHIKTRAFIEKHPDLFENGDIFTPAPEPENGLIRDPRHADGNKTEFLKFLTDSYSTCATAMKKVKKDVRCGYFSMNGDVAREIMTKEAVASSGGVLVIDHYVKEPEKLVKDVEFLYEKYGYPVVLGEFGAPIPDINGNMTPEQQSGYITDVLTGLLRLKEKVGGMNYWTAFDGTTQLFQKDLVARPAASALSLMYKPSVLRGTVTDQFHAPLKDVTLMVAKGAVTVKTNADGVYELPLPNLVTKVVVSPPDETLVAGVVNVELETRSDMERNIILSRTDNSFYGRVVRFLRNFVAKILSQ